MLLRVALGDVPVGHLAQDEQGRVAFRFFEEYKRRVDRPVLGQAFEDDLDRTYRGKHRELPAFFANLLPEPGPLRDFLESNLGIARGDDLALLAALGRDLPGAVEVTVEESDPGDLDAKIAGGPATESLLEPASEEPEFRFSLAGVQWKFSVLRDAERVTLPVRGRRGDWIVKLDSARFPQLVENEYAVLEWARSARFEVPECHVQPASVLAEPMASLALPGSNVLVLKRYDRDGARRIQQEDFAQVTSLRPDLKYDQVSYEQCAALVRQISGEEAYYEFVRRLAFTVASGNTDAHLKNWSFLYPDGVRARLSPLYDQVSTIAWDLPPKLALRFCGKKHLLEVDEGSFRTLAEKAGGDVPTTVAVLGEMLERIALGWRSAGIAGLLPAAHEAALRRYWQRSRLLQPFCAQVWGP